MTQNSLSFSCQSKQDSRCCINFPHELTCQFLTNQSIKTERRAWPTRDHCEKSKQQQLSSLPVKAGWIFASEVRLKSNFYCAAHKHNMCHMNLRKIKIEPAITWELVTCQRITSEPAIRSSNTSQRVPCFDSCQLIKPLMFKMCALSVFLCSHTS